MQLLWTGTLHWDVVVGRHRLRQKNPKDGGCPMLRHTDTTIATLCFSCIMDLAPALHASASHIFIRRNSSLGTFGRTCELHWTTFEGICKNFKHRTNATPHSQLSLRKPNIHHSNALSLPLDIHETLQARANFHVVSSLPRPTRSRVVPSSRLVCTYIYKATECELAPLMSQISNVHPATLS